MHEFSLASSILETVDESARQSGASRVLKVSVVAGELVQVVDEAMHFAFEVLAEGTICEGAELELSFVEPRSRCLDCGREFFHDARHWRCPECGGPNTELLAGRELYIDSIEVDLPG